MDHIDRSNRHLSVYAGILIALAVPGLPISRWEREFAGVSHLVGYELIWWTLIAYLLFHVTVLERRSLSSIGMCSLRPVDYVIAILAGISVLAALATIYFVVFPMLGWSEAQQVNQLLGTPLWWRALSVIRAAVGEEVLFRGYAITRLKEITSNLTFAAAFSCAVFTLEHVGPWGWSHLLLQVLAVSPSPCFICGEAISGSTSSPTLSSMGRPSYSDNQCATRSATIGVHFVRLARRPRHIAKAKEDS